MKSDLLELLVCSKCQGNLDMVEPKVLDDELLSARLFCPECSRTFALIEGIPRMVQDLGEMKTVAESFGFQWRKYFESRFEEQTLYGRTAEQEIKYFLSSMGISKEDIEGKRILDAGCGCGKLTRMLGELGAREVVGVDISEAAVVAYEHCRSLPNVHIIRADIFDLPFGQGTFDYVWSNGVIHHTPNARLAHERLSLMVKNGGKMYIWVYSKETNPFRFTVDVLRRLRIIPRLSGGALFLFCRVIALPSYAALSLYRLVGKFRPLRPKTIRDASKARSRSYKEICFTWFDTLSPEFDSRHTLDEVIGWFRDQGFRGIRSMDYLIPYSSQTEAEIVFGAASGVGVSGFK